MKYEFLNRFTKRMKTVGMYALLMENSMQKTTWKNFGVDTYDEQVNWIFVVLLFIMENSLKETQCTMDEIAAYLDDLNNRYFHKKLTFEQCGELADFIVGTILSNDGAPQGIQGYSFEKAQYETIPESYIANRIVYNEKGEKRTSYYLTDDGYSLVLGTLEMENNMKLSIHEMIFQLQLEKQNYDEALEEIRNVFTHLRIQQQKIQETMTRIRRNALNYTVEEYDAILSENIATISDTRKRYDGYRREVQERARTFEQERLREDRLTDQDMHSLQVLKEIASYLDRAVEEYQKILSEHLDLKDLYTKELENLSEMSLVRRYPFRQEIYDRVLENPSLLANADRLLAPLLLKDPPKGFNLRLLFRPQKRTLTQQDEETELGMDFDPEKWAREQHERMAANLLRYEKSLSLILDKLQEKGSITLQELARELTEEEKKTLIPDTDVFKEIMVELMKCPELDLPLLRQEEQKHLQEETQEFHLVQMLLQLVEREGFETITKIRVLRRKNDKPAVFTNVQRPDGTIAAIRCTNVQISVIRSDVPAGEAEITAQRKEQ